MGTAQPLMNTTEAGNGKALRLPDFIHIGPPRTGTTWLQEALSGHVGLPAEKETLFFELRYERGMRWYGDFFKDVAPKVRCGEIAPSYFANAVARERIQRDIPNCKIVCTLRDPATRLYSQYRFLRRGRTVPRSFDFDRYWRSLVHWGSDLCGYATQLRRWQEAFGAERLLVLFYDDLMSNPQGYLNQLSDFVGTPRVPLEKSPVSDVKVLSVWSGVRTNPVSGLAVGSIHWLAQHGGSSLVRRTKHTRIGQRLRVLLVEDYEPLTQSAADEIRHIMLPETEELERMTGRDLSKWKPGALRNGNPAREDPHARAS
jgi:hypothetical protein